MKYKIVLRADGSSKIGFGHIYRLIALIEMLYEDFDCTIVSHEAHQFLLDIAQVYSVSFVKVNSINYPSPDSRKIGDEVPFDMGHILTGDEIVVIDGYWFGVNYQKRIKEKGCKLICVDDLAEQRFICDVIINHSPGADQINYRCEQYTKLCIGLEYVLIRSVFLNKPQVNRPQKSRRILISMGGSDQYGFTPKLIEACIPAIEANDKLQVLITHSFQEETRIIIESLARQYNDSIDLVGNLDGKELCDLLDSCTHAIIPSSTIALEAIARGLKPLLGYYVDNQINMFTGITKRGLGIPLGNLFEKIDRTLIKQYLDTPEMVSSFFVEQKTKGIFNEFANTKM
jgi:spore coat polysaccharide biosynthesis predicted glycosyltransferase SpsG